MIGYMPTVKPFRSVYLVFSDEGWWQVPAVKNGWSARKPLATNRVPDEGMVQLVGVCELVAHEICGVPR